MKTVLAMCLLFSFSLPAWAQEASPDDEIIVKSVDAVVFAMKTNLKLTDDQTGAVRPVVTEYTVKVRDLQLDLEAGKIQGPAMYVRRQQLTDQEDRALGAILDPNQMRTWVQMQQDQSV